MCFDFGELDAAGAAGPAAEVRQRRPSDLKHGVLDEKLVYDAFCDILDGGATQGEIENNAW